MNMFCPPTVPFQSLSNPLNETRENRKEYHLVAHPPCYGFINPGQWFHSIETCRPHSSSVAVIAVITTDCGG